MNRSLPAMVAMHDRLLAEKPDDADHDKDSCPLCAMREQGGQLDDPQGGLMDKTYTEDEFKAALDQAVAEATAELSTKVHDLESAAQTTEVAAAQKAVREELEPRIAELQAQLDEKVLEAQAAATERDAIKAWLEAEATAEAESAALEARKEGRIEAIKKVASFPEEYLSANAERFAAMSDDDFQVALDGWAAVSKPTETAGEGDGIPNKTGLHAGRESTNNNGAVGTATKELLALRRTGRPDFASL